MALCDNYRRYGPHKEDAQYLSGLISVAVDFAKHGKCVDKENYEKIQKRVGKYPDYMEPKANKVVYESEHVLGKIYRAVDCK
jgi:hypothetical protein